MNLYSLLILTKKSSKNVTALEKTEFVLFPGRILPYKQTWLQYTTLYTTNTHRLRLTT